MRAVISRPAQVMYHKGMWTCRCPFCVKAKNALKGMNAKFVAIELDQMPDGAALRAELAKVSCAAPATC